MASTTHAPVRTSVRTRQVTGPRLRPAARSGRGGARPGGVAAPTVARPVLTREQVEVLAARVATVAPGSQPRDVDHGVTEVRQPGSRATGAPLPVHVAEVRVGAVTACRRQPTRSRVRLTDRGLLAILVAFGVLAATAGITVLASFFSVSNAPVHDPAQTSAVVAAAPAADPSR